MSWLVYCMSRSRVHHYFALPWRMSGGRCARFFAQHTALYLGSHSLCQLVLSFTLQVCLWAGSQTFLQLSRELGQQLLVQNSFIDVLLRWQLDRQSPSVSQKVEELAIWQDYTYIHIYIHTYIHTYMHYSSIINMLVAVCAAVRRKKTKRNARGA